MVQRVCRCRVLWPWQAGRADTAQNSAAGAEPSQLDLADCGALRAIDVAIAGLHSTRLATSLPTEIQPTGVQSVRVPCRAANDREPVVSDPGLDQPSMANAAETTSRRGRLESTQAHAQQSCLRRQKTRRSSVAPSDF